MRALVTFTGVLALSCTTTRPRPSEVPPATGACPPPAVTVPPTGPAPSLLVQDGHLYAVYDSAVSADGSIVATAAADNSVRLWHARTGRLLQVTHHESPPIHLSYLPAPSAFLSVTREGTARLIDPVSGSELATGAPHYGPTVAATSPNGRRFALASGIGDAQLAVLSPGMRPLRTDPRPVEGRHLHVYQAGEREPTTVLPLEVDVADLLVADDGTVVTAAAEEVRLWPPGSRVPRWSAPLAAETLELAGDGKHLFASSRAAPGQAQTHWVSLASGAIVRSVPGRLVATHVEGIATEQWQPPARELRVFAADGSVRARVPMRAQISAAAFSHDGSLLFVGDHAGGVHRVEVAHGGRETARTFLPARPDFRSYVGTVSVAPDTSRLSVGLADGSLLLLDPTTLQAMVRVESVRAPIVALAFSPDSRLLGVGDEDGGVTVWSLSTGARVMRARAREKTAVAELAFSPDSKRLQAQGTEAWTVADGRPAATFEPAEHARLRQGRTTVLSSPDGQHQVVYSSDGFAIDDRPPSLETWGAGAADADISTTNRVAIATREPTVLVYDLASSERVAQLRGHTAPLSAVRYSPDARFLASASDDGSVILWGADDYRRVLTLHVMRDDEWIATTPGGAYVASAEASVYVNWVFRAPLEVFSFNQFATALEQPDLVRSRLTERARDVERFPRPPRLSFSRPTPFFSRAGTSSVSFELDAVSASQVASVSTYVDGRRVASQAVCQGQATVRVDVPLLPGANRVTFVATDDHGYTSAPTITNVEAPWNGARPNLHLVAIGIDRYPNVQGKDLQVAAADARAIAAAFGGQVGQLYGALASSQVLLDGEASPAAILRALDALAAMQPRDLAVVSFAGHGLRDPATGAMYFITGEFDGTNLATAGISWLSIRDKLAAGKGRVLVLLDACHAGSFAEEQLGPTGDVASALWAEGRSGAVVFAASKGRQESLELGTGNASRALELVFSAEAALDAGIPRGHGVFTSAVLEALAGSAPDVDGSGALELSELEAHVTRRVREVTGGAQVPWIARREMVGDFVVAQKRPRR